MKKIASNAFILKTGKTINAYNGTFGLNEYLHLTEGYDGWLFCEDSLMDNEPLPFTKEEFVEISDYMIDLWEKFREKHGK
jgi:hypothetical protein